MARHDAEMLELVIEGPPQRPIVRLRGEVDLSNAPQLLHDLVSVCYRAPRGIVIDLAETTFLDCRGASALIIARRVQQSLGHSFELRGAQGGVRKILEWTGLIGSVHDGCAPPHLGSPFGHVRRRNRCG